MVFVDTSAFFAILDADDAMHATAAAYLTTAMDSRTRLITSNYVGVEASALVRSRLGPAAHRVFTDELLPVAEVEWITPREHAAATSAFLLVAVSGPSLVDRTSFEVMRALGIKIAFAHNRHFAQAGFESVTAD